MGFGQRCQYMRASAPHPRNPGQGTQTLILQTSFQGYSNGPASYPVWTPGNERQRNRLLDAGHHPHPVIRSLHPEERPELVARSLHRLPSALVAVHQGNGVGYVVAAGLRQADGFQQRASGRHHIFHDGNGRVRLLGTGLRPRRWCRVPSLPSGGRRLGWDPRPATR